MGTLIALVLLVLVGVCGFLAYQARAKETREARTVKSLPPSVQHVVAQMDASSQSAFFNEYETKKKSVFVGYLAWFFFGWHYLYTSKVGLQFAFWFTGGGCGLWSIADLFRMPSIIGSANEVIARQCLQTLHLGAQFTGVGNLAAAAAAPAAAAPVAAPPAPPQPTYQVGDVVNGHRFTGTEWVPVAPEQPQA